jgi:hypothetical protein
VRVYANVTPSRSGCRHATRTSRISPLCPTMSVNDSGSPSASATFSKTPEADRSITVQEARLPSSLRMCAGKFVAACRLSRRSELTRFLRLLALRSDLDVDDLSDDLRRRLLGGRGSFLRHSHGHTMLFAEGQACTKSLQLRSPYHGKITVSRDGDHMRLLPILDIGATPIKKLLSQRIFNHTGMPILDAPVGAHSIGTTMIIALLAPADALDAEKVRVRRG